MHDLISDVNIVRVLVFATGYDANNVSAPF